MNFEHGKKIGLGIGFLLLQVLLFRHLKIFQMKPDLVLIFLLWYASEKDGTSSILMAGALGFLQDALLDLWGLHMFSKTLIIFIGYHFISERSSGKWVVGQVFVLVFIAALVHNLIFLGINTAFKMYSAEFFFWQVLFGNSLYTATIASLIHLFRSP